MKVNSAGGLVEMIVQPGKWLVMMLALAWLPLSPLQGEDTPARQKLARDYDKSVHPLLARLCLGCHSTKEKKGELDLERFTSLDQVSTDLKPWLGMIEQLETREMPPEDKPQPTAAERSMLVTWVREMLDAEARARAGDPGPIVLRRLNNAEYNYTIRDLTGVPTLSPTREFPVDGAAGEGFTNAGSAQVMSPALVSKYLDAGKDVADHAVLVPGGIHFSPWTSRRDQTDTLITRIRDFYRPFGSDSEGGDVPRSGNPGDPVEGARFSVAPYLSALLQERKGLEEGSVSLVQLAEKHDLNGRYLATLYEQLTVSPDIPSPVLDQLRARWQAAGPEDLPAFAAEVTLWQTILWK
ncbi:MAG: DUF1587 domain-containing protein, partial [Pirellulaceae bacterium]|nr:DUF1587 domain-containing protein [Pirellulaceae bacterium]